MTWVKPNESLGKQRIALRSGNPLILRLRFKFYPNDLYQFTRVLNLDGSSDEAKAIKWLYYQIASDHESQREFDLSQVQALWALWAQIQFGRVQEYPPHRFSGIYLKSSLWYNQTLKAMKLGPHFERDILSAVAKMHHDVRHLSKLEAMQQYIGFAQGLPFYGATTFEVFLKGNGIRNSGVKSLVQIAPKGLRLLNERELKGISSEISWVSILQVQLAHGATIRLEIQGQGYMCILSGKALEVMDLIQGYMEVVKIGNSSNSSSHINSPREADASYWRKMTRLLEIENERLRKILQENRIRFQECNQLMTRNKTI